ncbi:MAG: pyruvate carboxylase [Proteobacteria bacterium]|nr:pyruvate carboxylase [Pseudomonadota bacterium]
MAHIDFLDTTMRDGQQSLWGMRMQAGMALPVAPLIDRTGFKVTDLTGSSMFEVMIRHCQENPWEGLDLLVQAMPRTPIRAGMRANASVTFGVTPDALMDAWMRQLNVHGCRSFWIYDVLFNIDKMHRLAKVAKEFGAEVAGSIMFTLSPVHTDEYYADKTARIAASKDIDTILLYDTAGVLEKDRLKTLLPAMKAKAGGKPIEFHANNILGQSAKAYLDAIELGVSVLHTATRPMANGPSVPSTQIMAHNLSLLGHTHDLDVSLLAPVAEHFEKVGKAAGFLVNQYNEYDVLSIQHQIPGGMVGTLKAQLAQHNMSERLEEVLRETAVVRREMGYPGMATPFSQLVGIQAVLNVVNGDRYSIVTDEMVQYAAGFYGETAAPIDPNVLDKIMSSPRAKQVCANPPEQPSIAELRKRHGTDDDDELILRALVPAADLERMRAAGPVKRSFPLLASPELDQVRRLMRLAKAPVVQMRLGEMEVELHRSGH